jgi:sulfite reductase (NADPH) flavoprotein alpha-component
MQEDSSMLNEYLNEGDGHFYLCGPTWPAGDVRDAIVSAFITSGGLSQSDASVKLNELKEHERYILEVY